MLKKRLIAVLIVRDGQVVQSVRFKHTNAIHYNSIHAIECFNRWAVDEIIILNVARSPESRDDFSEIIYHISKLCFVPLSVGGWITDDEYAEKLLRSGADKLVFNTAFSVNHQLVKRLSNRFGQQCIVGSMDVKLRHDGKTTVWVDRGRIDTGVAPLIWAHNMIKNGSGEILFNSIDHDGARGGYNLSILSTLVKHLPVPVIAFGGVFSWDHLVEGLSVGAQAVAAANIFHYTEHSTRKAKQYLINANIAMRRE
ncbi:MAG: imidazole glycerol phosphate synthase subunit HisF [Desulfamplus sp.]|nr:imidazole glycerol phosphate synthase subunit HisF [Desulfamplus sp.]